MPSAPLSRGRPVTALFLTVGAVLAAAYAAAAPAPSEPEPGRLTLISPAAHDPPAPVTYAAAEPGRGSP